MSQAIEYQRLTDKPKPRHWLSLIQALAGFLASSILILLGILFFFYGLWNTLAQQFDPSNTLNYWLPASTMIALGILFLPSFTFGLAHYFGWNTPKLFSISSPPPFILLLFFILVVALGNLLSQSTTLFVLFLPIFHILGIGLPIAFFLSLGLKNLPGQSLQRRWGAFNSGLGLAPLIIMFIEILALLGFLLLIALWISIHPNLVQEMSRLFLLLKDSMPSQENTLKVLQPYLSQTSVVVVIVFFAAVIIPMIEEAIKPLGVYLLLGKVRRELDGFILGALCGGGYALIESFLFTSNNNDWTQAILSRSTTAIVHIFTTALMGSAIARAWDDRKFGRLFLAYLCSIFFHGTWNGFAMLYSIYTISDKTDGVWSHSFLSNVANLSPLMIIFLFLYLTFAFWFFHITILKQSGKIRVLSNT
ncbi:MAG: PrsW family glutamic-type intramembrane protease [Anaerolineales bacterium]